ncbi:MAG: O-antigen ligase family protein, partial [Acidobacteria bacterium]|nr:O-antigen ligase family protein [Acidobacteriota bacterium]
AENGAGIFLRGAASWLPLCMFFAMGVAPLMKTLRSARLMRAAAALMCILTFLTMSRSAWLALAAGAALALLAAPRRTARTFAWIVLGAGVIALAAGWLPALVNTVANRMPHTVTEVRHDPSLTERWIYFRLAWHRFQLSPLVGGGLAGIDSHEFIVVHNAYLQVLGELGALGALTFGLILWRWLAFLFRAWRSAVAAHDDARRIVAAVSLGMAAFFLTYFMAGHDLESAEPWIAMAMSSALYSSRHDAIWRRAFPRLAADQGSATPI